MTISLTKGKVAIIDDEDWPRLSAYTWHAQSDGKGFWYAATSVNGRTILMHRFLLRATKGINVHHINKNTLDNRRTNLESLEHGEHTAQHQSLCSRFNI